MIFAPSAANRNAALARVFQAERLSAADVCDQLGGCMKKFVVGFAALVLVMIAFVGGMVVDAAQVRPFTRISLFVQQRLGIYNPQLQSLYSEMTMLFAQEKPAKIVMLGDSLTEFSNWPALLGHTDIANRGIAGDTSLGVLRRLDQSVKSAKIVFLMVGINDPGVFITEENTKNNISKIVDELSKDSTVILQSTLLTRSERRNIFVRQIDQFEQDLCAKGKCTYVNLNAGLSQDGKLKKEYAIDAIHVNAAGYAAWATMIKPILDQELTSEL
jgi:lysophospholipase L1-like esterase